MARNSGARGTIMAKDTLLVIGIHCDELGFGDQVTALVDPARVDVMRIPRGIPQARTGPGERFYSAAQHHEMYLQVHQQVKGRYRLMIDLHQGLDESGLSADVFSHDENFLRCLGERFQKRAFKNDVRLIHIASANDRNERPIGESIADAEAKTWIPSEVWLKKSPLYVGLEVYLPTDDVGNEKDWEFAYTLISEIQACMPR